MSKITPRSFPLAYALLLALAACDSASSTPETTAIAAHRAALSTGRSVTVHWPGRGEVRIGLPRGSGVEDRWLTTDLPPDAQLPGDRLVQACQYELAARAGIDGWTDVIYPNSAPANTSDYVSGFTAATSLAEQGYCGHFQAHEVAFCLGTWAKLIADSHDPTYIVKQDSPFDVVPAKGDSVVPARIEFLWQRALAEHQDESQVLLKVEPPSASDRVSWLMLASEMFSSAFLQGMQALEKCQTSVLTHEPAHYDWEDGGERLPVGRINNSTWIADQVASSAQQLIGIGRELPTAVAAAADVTRAGSSDPAQASIQAWRGATDSRLEAADVLSQVPLSLFENGRMRELFAVRAEKGKPRTGSAVLLLTEGGADDPPPQGSARAPLVQKSGGEDELPADYFASTSPDLVASAGTLGAYDLIFDAPEGYGHPTSSADRHYVRSETLGWIYPPYLDRQPPGTKPLVTYVRAHLAGGPRDYWTTDRFGLRGSACGLGERACGSHCVRLSGVCQNNRCDPSNPDCHPKYRLAYLEGYVPVDPAAGDTVALKEYYIDYSQDFYSRVSDYALGLRPPDTVYEETGHTIYVFRSPPPVQRFPVVTETLRGPEERAALEALTLSRANPCVAGSPSMCELALAGQPSRDADAVVRDVLAAIEEDRGHPMTLERLGTTRAALLRAARYVVQYAQVLGRPIYQVDEIDGVKRYSSVDTSGVPVSPWYLYATTTGSAFPTLPAGPAAFDSTLGIYHTINRFPKFHGDRLNGKADISDEAHKILKAVKSTIRQIVTGGVQVHTTPNSAGDDLTDSKLRFYPPWHLGVDRARYEEDAGEEIKRTVDAWLGEVGLACAAGGPPPYGHSCDDFKFGEEGWKPVPWGVELPLLGANRPKAMRSASGSRVYVTSLGEAGVSVVFGTTLSPRIEGGEHGGPVAGSSMYEVPLSPALLKGLTDSLAADSYEPQSPATTCTDLPRRVKLEDELSEAFTGADGIESSFAYHLDLATKAAHRADMLGEEMLRTGLALDQRAEAARDELEKLCGGVVNVPDFLCEDTSGCDVAGELDAAAADGEYSALQQCINDTETTNVALGDRPVCLWRVGSHPYCTCPPEGPCPGYCPEDAVDCHGPKASRGGPPACAVLVMPSEGDDPAAVCDRAYDGAMGLGRPHVDGVRYELITDVLNLARVDGGETSGELPPSMRHAACQAFDILVDPDGFAAREDGGGQGATLSDEEREALLKLVLEAIDYNFLADAGRRLGVKREPYNIPTITLESGAWWGALQPGEELTYEKNGTAVRLDVPLVEEWPCGPKGLKPAGDPSCVPPADTDDAATKVSRARAIGDRLAKAVELLKVIEGPGLKGLQVVATRGRLDDSLTYRSWDPERYETEYEKKLGPTDQIRHAAPFGWNAKGSKDYYDRNGAVRPKPANAPLPLLEATVEIAAGKACSQWEPFWEDQEITDFHQYCFEDGWSHEFKTGMISHGTYRRGLPQQFVSVTATCLDETNSASEQLGEMLGLPVCDRRAKGALSYFYDAADLITWPRMGSIRMGHLQEAEHPASLTSYLERALTAPEGVEAAAHRPLAAVGSYTVDGETYQAYVGYSTMRRSYPALSNFTNQNLIDAVDLACRTLDPEAAPPKCDAEDYSLDNLERIDDLQGMAGATHCMAREMRENIAKNYLINVPKSVAKAFATQGAVDVSQAFSGEYAVHAGALQRALFPFVSNLNAVAREIEADQSFLVEAESELQVLADEQRKVARRVSKRATLARIRCARAFMGATAQAAGALAGVKEDSPWGNSMAALAGAAAFAEAALACKEDKMMAETEQAIAALEDHQIEEQKKQALVRLFRRLQGTQGAIEAAIEEAKKLLNEAQTALAELNNTRNAAQNALGRVLLSARQGERLYSVNSVMRSQFSTARARYEEAFDNALKLAYIARRSVEQRLGVDLETITEDMALVEAPSKWVGKLCGMSGIDYARLRNAGQGTNTSVTVGNGSTDPVTVEVSQGGEQDGLEPDIAPAEYDYSEGFIGDYVEKLRLALESYRFDAPSQDGEDLVIVSLRDTVHNVREQCVGEPRNLLYASVDPSARERWSASCKDGTLVEARTPRVVSGPFAPGTGTASLSGDKPGDAQAIELVSFTETCPQDAGPVAWFRADRASVDLEGQRVTAWRSRVGDYVLRPPSTSAAPEFEDADPDLGDQPALFFDGNAVLQEPALAELFRGGASVFAVVERTGGPVDSRPTVWSVGAPSGGYVRWAKDPFSPIMLAEMAGAGDLDIDSIDTDPLGAARALSYMYFDSEIEEGLRPADPSQFALGADVAGGQPADHWVGFISELIIFDRELRYDHKLGIHEYGDVWRALRAHYGLDGAAESEEPRPAEEDSPLTARGSGIEAAAYTQRIDVSPGEYVLSWYELNDVAPVGDAACGDKAFSRVVPQLITGDGDVLQSESQVRPVAVSEAAAPSDAVGAQAPEVDPQLNPCWERYAVSLTVPARGSAKLAVGFAPDPQALSVIIAAPQLERLDYGLSRGPSGFAPTSARDRATVMLCEDRDGDTFRTQHWKFACEPVCPPGRDDACRTGADVELEERCFYETTFSLPLESIERGELLRGAGFSAGNFNYRFLDVAVNVVGTDVKRCDRSETQSVCYANNFLQYSLDQIGPYRVRNYEGEVYEAPLYPGRIQQGKALLAERYLTNPLSGADTSLLSDYWDGELMGRPLDGTFHLRIYRDNALQWAAVEDVQMAIRYRYWTRLE